jgi:hypothetical protein
VEIRIGGSKKEWTNWIKKGDMENGGIDREVDVPKRGLKRN